MYTKYYRLEKQVVGNDCPINTIYRAVYAAIKLSVASDIVDSIARRMRGDAIMSRVWGKISSEVRDAHKVQ